MKPFTVHCKAYSHLYWGPNAIVDKVDGRWSYRCPMHNTPATRVIPDPVTP